MEYANPDYLISAEELAKIRTEPNVRIFDTSIKLHVVDGAFRAESGLADYTKEHIAGAGFIDLMGDWSDTNSALKNTLPTMQALSAAIGASGIHADDQVVLYSSGHLMWATRAWWCLHYAGHRNIQILNGNYRAWQAAGLPTASGVEQYPATTFSGQEYPEVFAGTDAVENAMGDQNVCTINALSTALYEGTGDFYYKRRGHIPGSRSLFYDDVLNNEFFLPADQLADILTKQNMLDAQQVIIYCGGGIAATLDGFACKLMGKEQVAVYDGSMSEWVQSDERPLTLGAQP